MQFRLYAFLSICAILLMLGSCDNPTSQPQKEELLDFSYFTESQYKAARTWKGNPALQSAADVPPYGCYVSVYQAGETKPWKFWSIALNYPKSIIKKADGAKVKVKIRIKDESGEHLIRMANCIIPRAPKAQKMLKKLMTKGARNVREDLGQNNSGKSSNKSNDPVINSCIIVQGGYKCPDGYCFVSEEMCQKRGGGGYSLPEIIVYGDDGGGSDDSGGGTGGDDDGGYDPPDGGPDPGGGGPCIDCDPGGDGSDSNCDPNAIDPPAGCEEKPEDCAGIEGGVAYIDGCGTCVGGITGKQSCCASFDKIMEFVLSAKSEGGYVNNPKDKGGPTNRGIAWLTWQETAQSTLGLEPTLANLKQLTKQQARKIYRLHFWRRSQADKFLDGDLAIFFFDFFINAPRSSTLRLQYLLSNMGYNVKIDGYIGGETRDAANYAIRDGKLKQLYNRYYQARIDHYKNRANTVPGQNTFLDGWLNRVNKFSEKTDSNLHNVNCNL